ncbi:MAG: hypothetical protein U1E16_04800 [Hyphomicrobiales bacterium]
MWPKLKADYIDNKKIRFIFREFPLNDLALAAFMTPARRRRNPISR